jgi:aminopeptidase N
MMKLSTSLIVLILAFITIDLSADDIPIFIENRETHQFEFKDYNNKYCRSKDDITLAPEKIVRPYDVLSYDIFLDWYDPFTTEVIYDEDGNYTMDESWDGAVHMKIVSQADQLDVIQIDAPFLEFNNVHVNYKLLTDVEFKSFEPTKNIPLSKVLNYGDTVQITIDYRFSGGRDRGFLIFPEEYYVGYNNQFDDTVFVEERVAYTHGEPEDNRFWVPCNDHPHDKALFTINIRLPKGYNAVSNGLLTEEGEYDAESDYFKWEHKYPMSTYLLAVTASKFHIFNDWYKKVTNPSDSIEVVYYVWEKDFLEEKTDGSRYNARHSFRNMIVMMERFSEFFVEYPFEKYGMVAVQPYGWGAMEHQTITTINRAWLRGRSDAGIAHELVHHWFGDMITCDSWADLWINEGGATWGEAIWNSFWGGDEAYNNTMISKRWGYLYYGNSKYTTPAYDVPSNQLFNYPITYCKSSWIYHMLYKLLGEDAFKQILRNMLNDYAYQPISTDQFINYVKQSIENPPDNLIDIVKQPKISIEEYFDQWLFKPGHPIYEMTVNVSTNPNDHKKYDINITMEQKQKFPNVPEVFKAPLRFDIIDGSGGTPVNYEEIFFNDEKIQTFTATYDFIPDTVLFDFSYTLAEIDTTYYQITSVEDAFNDISVSIFPNPVHSGNDIKLHYIGETVEPVRIAVIDILGNIIYESTENATESRQQYFRINTDNMNSGVYYINIRSGNKNYTSKIIVVN